ncbi:4Fe-4S cluster-binding domain-containing protein [Methanobrevibacter olleyae]|uniref:Pyruvate-formate lyase activating enzyme n=1 Tax=Methanobrevibacter olleyae TaxID=294671 RepID=A0A126R0H4_METOL|nr:4Fe-4S cluster-binding domain-containing protein [Methanobrevibacter olleyae]AMK15567.1 pyruvate-formate lyase activating enzyme [Methanobrevibacter olleyae]
MTVRITNIQRFSLQDGSGIRTTVFLKGCDLTCPWCCNPENVNFEIEDYNHNNKNESFGYDISLEELEKEILKDEIYYGDAKGGVTFSGGEPLLQIESLKPLLKNLKDKNINICFETSLSVSNNLLKIAILFIDELFIDIKLLDKKEAKEVLNLDMDAYYKNLELINNSKIKNENITFRIPLNKEYTLKEENIKLILKLIEKYPNFKVEIFKTHNLAKSKYESLNKEFNSFSEINDDFVNEIYKKIKKINSNVRVISL